MRKVFAYVTLIDDPLWHDFHIFLKYDKTFYSGVKVIWYIQVWKWYLIG